MGKIKGMEQPAFDGSKMTMSSTFGKPPVVAADGARSAGACSREQAGKVSCRRSTPRSRRRGRSRPAHAQYLLPPSVNGKQPGGRKADPPWASARTSASGTRRRAPRRGRQLQDAAGVGGAAGDRAVQDGAARRLRHRRAQARAQGLPAVAPEDGHARDGRPRPDLQPEVDARAAARLGVRNPPQWGFTTAGRNSASALALAHGTPGPATIAGERGPQVDSTKPGAPTPGFGASTRDTRAKLCALARRHSARPAPPCPLALPPARPPASRPLPRATPPASSPAVISTEHEKGVFGSNSPGPAANYKLPTSVGPQVLSRDKNAGRPSFSRVALGVVRARDSVEHDARAGQLQRLSASTVESAV